MTGLTTGLGIVAAGGVVVTVDGAVAGASAPVVLSVSVAPLGVTGLAGRLATSGAPDADAAVPDREGVEATIDGLVGASVTRRWLLPPPPSNGQSTPARWLPNVATAATNATAASRTGTATMTRRRDTYFNIGIWELQHNPAQSFVDRFRAETSYIRPRGRGQSVQAGTRPSVQAGTRC